MLVELILTRDCEGLEALSVRRQMPQVRLIVAIGEPYSILGKQLMYSDVMYLSRVRSIEQYYGALHTCV